MNNSVVSSKSTRVYRHRQDSPYYFGDKTDNSSGYKYNSASESTILNNINMEELSFNSKIKLLQKLVEAYRPELTDMNNRLEHDFYILFNSHGSADINEQKENNYSGEGIERFFWSEDYYVWHNGETNTLYIV